MKYYTGVGSRSTPKEVGEVMRKLAYKLADDGWTLRSGAAEGADTFFQQGATKWCVEQLLLDPSSDISRYGDVYIPWDGFSNQHESENNFIWNTSKWDNTEAEEIASRIHPAWDKCSRGAKALHSRNVYQVLGASLDTPSKFLVCWAETDKQGVPKGGTRTAWMLAKEYDIPCFNLYNQEDMTRVMKWLSE